MEGLSSHFKPNAHKTWIFGTVAYIANIKVMVPKFHQLYGSGLVNGTIKYNMDKARLLEDLYADHILYKHVNDITFHYSKHLFRQLYTRLFPPYLVITHLQSLRWDMKIRM